MVDLAPLLSVQNLDTQIDQLTHRRVTLPERAELAAAQRDLAAIESQTADVIAERDALLREQKRFEDEVAVVEEKAAAADRTLYGGTVTNPKELTALQADVESLRRRQRVLEDEVLVVMEQVEPLEERLVALRASRDAADVAVADLRARLAESETALDAQVVEVRAERAAVAESIPAEVMARYERLRPQLGGIAVARLVGSGCQGCDLNLTFPAAELDRIRHLPPGEVAECYECSRMLVR